MFYLNVYLILSPLVGVGGGDPLGFQDTTAVREERSQNHILFL